MTILPSIYFDLFIVETIWKSSDSTATSVHGSVDIEIRLKRKIELPCQSFLKNHSSLRFRNGLFNNRYSSISFLFFSLLPLRSILRVMRWSIIDALEYLFFLWWLFDYFRSSSKQFDRSSARRLLVSAGRRIAVVPILDEELEPSSEMSFDSAIGSWLSWSIACLSCRNPACIQHIKSSFSLCMWKSLNSDSRWLTLRKNEKGNIHSFVCAVHGQV